MTAPLPSSGGFALIDCCGWHDALAAQFAGLAHNSTQYVHLIAEMEKRVFADRAEYLGDPDFVQVPIERADRSGLRRAARRRGQPASIYTGRRASSPACSEDCTRRTFPSWIAQGNAVSNTYTLNDWFGDGVVVEGAGFLLNNEMDDFTIKPGVPNMYGVVGGSANAIAPGKRLLSSMAPTILTQERSRRAGGRHPWGLAIFTSVFQVLNIYDFHMTPQQAVAAAALPSPAAAARYPVRGTVCRPHRSGACTARGARLSHRESRLERRHPGHYLRCRSMPGCRRPARARRRAGVGSKTLREFPHVEGVRVRNICGGAAVRDEYRIGCKRRGALGLRGTAGPSGARKR